MPKPAVQLPMRLPLAESPGIELHAMGDGHSALCPTAAATLKFQRARSARHGPSHA